MSAVDPHVVAGDLTHLLAIIYIYIHTGCPWSDVSCIVDCQPMLQTAITSEFCTPKPAQIQARCWATRYVYHLHYCTIPVFWIKLVCYFLFHSGIHQTIAAPMIRSGWRNAVNHMGSLTSSPFLGYHWRPSESVFWRSEWNEVSWGKRDGWEILLSKISNHRNQRTL